MDRAVAQILVVEDETLQRTVLLDALRSHGHSVMGAGSAEEAVRVLSRDSVEVAIVDVYLPGRSGIDLLRAIRSDSPRTEVILITARPTVRVAIDSIQAGAFDLLLKPIDAQRLAASVKRAVVHGRERTTAAIREAALRLVECAPSELSQTAVEAVREVLEADETSLMVPHRDGGLEVAASTFLAPEVQASVRVRLGERVVGRVAANLEPLLLSGSLRKDPRFSSVEGDDRIVSSIVYPLVCRGVLQGVLTVGRRVGSRSFRAIDMKWAELTAGAVARALHQAALFSVIAEADHSLGLRWVLPSITHVLESLPPGMGTRTLRKIVEDLEICAQGTIAPCESIDMAAVIEAAVRLTDVGHYPGLRGDIQPGCRVLGRRGHLIMVLVALLARARGPFLEAEESDPGPVRVDCRLHGGVVVVEVAGGDLSVKGEPADGGCEPGSLNYGAGAGEPSLAWCEKIVSSHGGSMKARSDDSAGNYWALELPVAGSDAGQVA